MAMADTPITVKKVLDSMGGWENIKLCMDADRYVFKKSIDLLNIYYWKNKTLRILGIYANYSSCVDAGDPLRIYFVSPSTPCLIYCDGTINNHLMNVIKSATGLSLDLF